jgi:hypothetical protein
MYRGRMAGRLKSKYRLRFSLIYCGAIVGGAILGAWLIGGALGLFVGSAGLGCVAWGGLILYAKAHQGEVMEPRRPT